MSRGRASCTAVACPWCIPVDVLPALPCVLFCCWPSPAFFACHCYPIASGECHPCCEPSATGSWFCSCSQLPGLSFVFCKQRLTCLPCGRGLSTDRELRNALAKHQRVEITADGQYAYRPEASDEQPAVGGRCGGDAGPGRPVSKATAETLLGGSHSWHARQALQREHVSKRLRLQAG